MNYFPTPVSDNIQCTSKMQILYVHMQDNNVDICLICLYMQCAYYSYVDMQLFNVNMQKKISCRHHDMRDFTYALSIFRVEMNISCMSTKISKHVDINKSHLNVNFKLHADMILSHVIMIKHADVDKCHVNIIMTFGKQ